MNVFITKDWTFGPMSMPDISLERFPYVVQKGEITYYVGDEETLEIVTSPLGKA